MKKEKFSYILLFILIISSAKALVTIDYTFDKNIVYAIGYTCHNKNCSAGHVDQSPWGYNPSSPATTNGALTINYMNFPDLQAQSPNSYMVVYFHSPGYKARYHRIDTLPCSNCHKPDPINLPFAKATNCKSEVGAIQFRNNQYSDQPIVISVPANLSAATSAAFGCTDCVVSSYVSPIYIDYYSALTNVILTIKNSAGQTIHTQTIQKNILWQTTETVNFAAWTPTTPDTYSVEVRTKVVDDQCASNEEDFALHSVKVWERYPKDEYWTDIMGLIVRDQATTHIINQPLTVTFQKRSQYAPNYDPWETQYNALKRKVATNISIFLGYGTDWMVQESKLIPSSGAWGDYEQVEMIFTPKRAGNLKMKVNGTAVDTSSESMTRPNTLSSEPSYYDIEIKECSYGQSKDCYSGPENTLNKGAECKSGTQTCQSDGFFSTCVGQIIPQTEICDGKDNDCDGQKDENCNCVNGTTIPCSQLMLNGLCSLGTATCQNGQWFGCPSPKTENCTDTTFLDEDCDGKANCYDIDSCPQSIWKDTFNPCTQNCPVGYYDLNNDKICEYKCTPTIDPKELCDNIDNDCNGQTDDLKSENLPLCKDVQGMTSLRNSGVCEGLKASCDSQKRAFVCNMTGVEMPNEITCDNLDNDCDGTVDEDIIKSESLSGICMSNQLICKAGKWTKPDNYVEPEAEICGDLIDNNCNGDIDETCACTPGATRECGKNKGVCTKGIEECMVDKTWGECSAVMPSNEICDGKDNDCDGETDEGNADCCSPEGRTRQCSDDPRCPKIVEGTSLCQNYVWQECHAQCPAILTMAISNPGNGQNYLVCKGEQTKPIIVEFTPPGTECTYQKNVKSQGTIVSGNSITFPVQSGNTLTIKCNQLTSTVTFNVIETDCISIPIETDVEKLAQNFGEMNLTSQDMENAEKTAESLDQVLDVTYEGDDTVMKHSLDPKKALENVNVALFIPKCLSPYLSQIQFESKGFKVIKEDPLIAWHFDSISEKVDISYRIKGKVPKNCLEQIKLLPIAQMENELNKKKGIDALLFPSLVIAIIVALIIYIQRFHPEEIKAAENSYHDTIEKQWEKYLNEIKNNHPKTKDQAEQIMKNMGYHEELRDWIQKKLKLPE